MKALAWIVVLFAVAVGVTLFARYNTGYVLLVIAPWRIEFSLNVLLLALAAVFAAGYAIVRTTSATMRLPLRVREYRLARRREEARTSLAGCAARIFRRALRARGKGGRRGDRCGEQPQLAAVLAARAAHELRAWDRRDQYLERAGGGDPDRDVMRVVTEADLLLEQRRHQEALERLKALPRKHTAALRLELKAQQQAHQLGARGSARRRAREARRIRRGPGGAGAALRARRRLEAEGARHAHAGGGLAPVPAGGPDEPARGCGRGAVLHRRSAAAPGRTLSSRKRWPRNGMPSW